MRSNNHHSSSEHQNNPLLEKIANLDTLVKQHGQFTKDYRHAITALRLPEARESGEQALLQAILPEIKDSSFDVSKYTITALKDFDGFEVNAHDEESKRRAEELLKGLGLRTESSVSVEKEALYFLAEDPESFAGRREQQTYAPNNGFIVPSENIKALLELASEKDPVELKSAVNAFSAERAETNDASWTKTVSSHLESLKATAVQELEKTDSPRSRAEQLNSNGNGEVQVEQAPEPADSVLSRIGQFSHRKQSSSAALGK